MKSLLKPFNSLQNYMQATTLSVVGHTVGQHGKTTQIRTTPWCEDNQILVRVCASDIGLLTDGNSKSFWLTRLRMYSMRYRFSGHANCTGGVRVLIAVTMVCHKHTYPNNIQLNVEDRKTADGHDFRILPRKKGLTVYSSV